MNTEYLKEFVVLAQTNNFWEASQRLYMNQSTLSKHIKSLESELKVELFSRTTRKVALTMYGQTFLPYAKSIIKADREAMEAIKRLKNIENGLLTIGCIPAMPQYGMTQFIAQFQKEYPHAAIRISEEDSTKLIENLMDETCELIFLREEKISFEQNYLKDTQLIRIPFMEDKMVVLMNKTNPLSNQETIDILQLKDEQFCLIKEGSIMYDMAMNACQAAGFIPNIIFTSHRLDCIVDMVVNQNCVALLMDKHVTNNQDDCPWKTIQMTPEMSSQISLCYRKDKPLSATAKQFIKYYKSNIDKMA